MEVQDQGHDPDLQIVVTTEDKPTDNNAAVGQKLLLLASFAKELQTQSHLIHFNYCAPNFLAVHEFLKAQYEGHTLQFDQLGEYVRILNYYMPMCSVGLKDALGPCFKHCDCYEPAGMLTTYHDNLGTFEKTIKMVEPAAQAAEHYDVANYLGELLGETCKSAWMIRATLQH